MGGVHVAVSARSFAVPYECPCCGAPPDSDLAVPAPRETGARRTLVFPYCKRCADHAALWDSAGMLSAGLTVLGLSTAVAIGLATRWFVGAALAAATIAAAYLLATRRRAGAKAAMAASCAGPGVAVSWIRDARGVRAFAFASPTYTARFAEQNTRVLAQPSDALQRLLSAHRVARLQVPTPAAAVTVASSPPTVAEWMAKLEASTGRAACREQLQRALEVIHDPADRRELIRVATRLELAAVIARLHRLSNRASQLQHLRAAMAEVEADNLPDELRAAELAQLQARIDETR